MQKLLIPIAITSDGKHVNACDTVKSIDYYCPECKSKLILKDGNKKIKHLSHRPNPNCLSASNGESLIHKIAKDIICELSVIKFKEQKADKIVIDEGVITAELSEIDSSLKIISADQEKRLPGSNYVSDVVIKYDDGFTCYIEVTNTHKTDIEKIQYMRENRMFCLEVVLPKFKNVTYESIRDYIKKDFSFKVLSSRQDLSFESYLSKATKYKIDLMYSRLSKIEDKIIIAEKRKDKGKKELANIALDYIYRKRFMKLFDKLFIESKNNPILDAALMPYLRRLRPLLNKIETSNYTNKDTLMAINLINNK